MDIKFNKTYVDLSWSCNTCTLEIHVCSERGIPDILKYTWLKRSTNCLHTSETILKIEPYIAKLWLSEIADSMLLEAANLNSDH
jgi:hypothetical protein